MILKSVRNNKIESFIIITIFTMIVSFIVYFICWYYDFGVYSIVIAFIFSFITSFASYYNSDKIVLALNGARQATKAEYALLNSILDSLVISSNLPRPKLYVMDDDSLNAFATGRNPENAVICFTTGIIQKLDKYELEGVMAHELSHIKNYDILLSTIVSVFVGMIVMLSDIFVRFRFRSSSDENKNPILLIVGLLALILAPIFSTIIKLCLSRKREYLADATAVEFTRNPKGLISALKKLSTENKPLQRANKATENMYIVNPFNKFDVNEAFSTHPSIEKRIQRLENIR